jgi:hypothetical protein
MKRAERAMQIWQVLISAAHNRQTLTYDMLGKLIGMGANVLAQTLGCVMDYCKRNGLPPLTVLVVRRDTGEPGTGLTTAEDLNRDRESVYAYEWYKMPPVQVQDFEALPCRKE